MYEMSSGPQRAVHAASFTPAYGGAEIYVYDVDGDGLNDVITSLAAHDMAMVGLTEGDSTRRADSLVDRTRRDEP